MQGLQSTWRSGDEKPEQWVPGQRSSGESLWGFIFSAGIQFVLEKGIEQIRNHEVNLIQKLIDGLKEFPQVTLYGPENGLDRTATLSFNVAHLVPSEAAFRLEREFGILCRPGLQCAPAAHRTIGTFPEGTIRLSLSYLNSEEHVDQAIQAVSQLARE